MTFPPPRGVEGRQVEGFSEDGVSRGKDSRRCKYASVCFVTLYSVHASR